MQLQRSYSILSVDIAAVVYVRDEHRLQKSMPLCLITEPSSRSVYLLLSRVLWHYASGGKPQVTGETAQPLRLHGVFHFSIDP